MLKDHLMKCLPSAFQPYVFGVDNAEHFTQENTIIPTLLQNNKIQSNSNEEVQIEDKIN